MDTCDRHVPTIIPNTILNVLCILEEDSGRFNWKITRNQDGISLVIKTQPVRARQNQPTKRRSNGNTKQKSVEKVLETSAKATPLTKPRKKKSPSTISRDKARLQAYRERKKVASRKTRSATDVQISQKRNPEQNASVDPVSKLELLSRAQVNSPSATCEQLPLGECAPPYTTGIDSDDESEQESVHINTCARCKKELQTEIKCPKCKKCSYCSTECQDKDWADWHKFACRPV